MKNSENKTLTLSSNLTNNNSIPDDLEIIQITDNPADDPNSNNINNGICETNITMDFENQINSPENNNKNKENKKFAYSDINNQKYPRYGKGRKYGNTISFLNFRNGPLFVIGPDWYYYIILTFILLLTFLGVYIGLSNKINFYIKYIGITIYLIQFLSYSGAALLNPGLADNRFLEDQNFEYDKNIYHPCPECRLLILNDSTEITYHCFECDVCIVGYDHHCPWTSKCIGKNNIIMFYVFVISTIAYLMILFISLVTVN